MATSPNYGWLEPDNTDLVKNGALAIRTLGNAIDTTMATMTPKSTYTAKGSIAAATGASTPANLAVGNNGETLVADSSTSTGLRYQGNFAAGKNAIINGAFNVWQRGTSFTPAGSGNQVYTADRFSVFRDGSGTVSVSQQSFTPGTAPVSGYESQYYLRFAQSVAGTGGTYSVLEQRIEDVRTFAGQTITLSFWAKGAAGATLPAPSIAQYFGSGGSSTVYTVIGTSQTLTTSWQRFSFTGTIPAISGKTIGTGSSLGTDIALLTNTAFTWDFWGVQVEVGNTATAFQTATGTLQGELAACQRYYFRTAFPGRYGSGFAKTTTTAAIITNLPVPLRVQPTALEQSGTAADYLLVYQASASACSSVPTFSNASGTVAETTFTVGAVLTAGNGVNAGSNSSNAYLGWSAEL
jgi:hypothetical protein